MAKPVCMVPGKELSDAAEDFRSAKRIEQYRVSEKALYLPEGLRWKYLPFFPCHQCRALCPRTGEAPGA